MNLTDRDKTLIFVFIVILLVGIFYFLPYKSLTKSQMQYTQDVAKLQSEYNILQQDVIKKEQYQKDIVEFGRMIEKSNDRFPTDNSQERIIYTLNDMETNLDILFTDVVFGNDEVIAVSDEEAYKKEEEYYQEAAKLRMLNREGEIPEFEFESYDTFIKKSIATSIYADYDEIKDLLTYLYPEEDEMNNIIEPNDDPLLDRRIVLESLSIQKSDQDSDKEFQLSFILDFYALENPTREDGEVYLGEYPMGKEEGIFEEYESLGGVNVEGDSSGAATQTNNGYGSLIEDEPDFFIMLKPRSADIDSVVVGKGNDNKRDTYVYSEGNSTVDVEINVYTYNDEYYFRYKAGSDAYPSNYNSGVKFIPGEYVELKVISTDRLGVDDLAGANVTIINETDIPFNVYYFDEDEERPRFNVVSTEGNVILP